MNKSFRFRDVFMICFPVAAVWIGGQVGPALAAGTTAKTYFASFGSYGIWSAIISQIACGILIFFGSELGRIRKCRDYKSSSQFALGRLGEIKWFWKLYLILTDILTFVAMCLTSALMFNMMGQVLIAIFHCSTFVAYVICAVLFVISVMWGTDVLAKLSTGLTIAMVFCFALIFGFGWVLSRENALHFFNVFDTLGTTGSQAFAMCWAYIGIQYGFSRTCCMFNQRFTSWRHSLWVAIAGVVVNCVFLILSILNVLCYYPESFTYDAPHLQIILNFYSEIAPWMQWIYYITMILACVSTAVTAIISLVVRWKPIVFKNSKLNDFAQQGILSSVLMAICIALSFLGMTTIMSEYYSKVGTLNLWMGIIPYLVIWPINYFRMGKKKREELAAMPELSERGETA